MKKPVKVLLFCATCVIFIGCDRITKGLAREHLMYCEPISYFHNTFILEYVENTGAALSMGDQLSKTTGFWLLSILPLTFMLALFIYIISKISDFSRIRLFALALIVAGGFGNLIDRILYDRHVTDFMNVGISSLRTGIFNVADMCVTAGVIIFAVSYKTDKQPEVKVGSDTGVSN